MAGEELDINSETALNERPVLARKIADIKRLIRDYGPDMKTLGRTDEEIKQFEVVARDRVTREYLEADQEDPFRRIEATCFNNAGSEEERRVAQAVQRSLEFRRQQWVAFQKDPRFQPDTDWQELSVISEELNVEPEIIRNIPRDFIEKVLRQLEALDESQTLRDLDTLPIDSPNQPGEGYRTSKDTYDVSGSPVRQAIAVLPTSISGVLAIVDYASRNPSIRISMSPETKKKVIDFQP